MTDNEHSWFAKIFAGLDEPGFYATEDDPQAEWRIDPGDTIDTLGTANDSRGRLVPRKPATGHSRSTQLHGSCWVRRPATQHVPWSCVGGG
jgi:hypothetical protein